MTVAPSPAATDMKHIEKLNRLSESHGALQPGKGMVSGVIALMLAALCFLGVLAFHFPEYLTTPELRRSYNVDVMRLLLFWSLVLSGALALFNVVRSRARWLALAAFALIGLSLALGGHKVPVNDFADGTPYIGLDWFILDLLGSTLIFVFIEKLFALRKDQPVFRPEWQTDFHHFLVNHMIVGFVLLATNLLVHELFGWAAKDGIRAWVQDLPFFVALFLIVLVADLVQYWTHRAYHEVPLLWRLHAVHHSVKDMDWLAGSRQHILELIITRTLVLAPIFVLGFSKEVIDAYIVFVGFQAVFNHANVSVRLGPLRYLIVTPNFHHWHHSADTEGSIATTPPTSPSSTTPSAPPTRPSATGPTATAWSATTCRTASSSSWPSRSSGRAERRAASGRREGLRRHHRRRRRRPALRGDRRPARPFGRRDRSRRQGRREDPHLGRRPLQLHQHRRRPAAFRFGQSRLLPLGAGALHAARLHRADRAPRHCLAREAQGPAVLRRLEQRDHRHAARRMRGRPASSAGTVRGRRRAPGRRGSCSTPVAANHALRLVVATGGLSIPAIGASALGYALARRFGHRTARRARAGAAGCARMPNGSASPRFQA